MSIRVKATVLELNKKTVIAWRWKTSNSAEFQSAVAKAKAVHGSRFRPSEKVWTAPATVDTCTSLRREYGDALVVKKPLAKWFKKNSKGRKAQESLSAARDAELVNLPGVAPALAATLRPDQRAGALWVASGYRGAGLVADKPGLGKTLITIAGVLEAERKGNILVLCPKISVWNVWRRELLRWTNESVHVARGTRAKREAAIEAFLVDPAERKWLIIVAEMLRVKRKANDTGVKANANKRGRIEGFEYPQLFSVNWDTIIADESHRLLGSLTISKSNLAGEGLAKLPQPSDARRYALSGTPFGKGGRVQGMFGTLNWLWPDEFTSFWRWADAHFEVDTEEVKRGVVARKIVGLREGLGKEAFLASLGPRILRRTKEEVLKNLPPKQYVEVLCEATPPQKKQSNQLAIDGEFSVKGGSIIANGSLAMLTRARQIANGALRKEGDAVRYDPEGSGKADALFEKLETRGILDGSGDTKVIISSRFNAFLEDVIIPRLENNGVKYHLLTGKTSDKKRDAAMDEFQGEGGAKVFVLNSKAGGVSINLDAADEVHCLDELDNPEDNEQLEDRAHRASRNHQVTIFYYRTEGTVDTNIAEKVEDKRLAQFEVLDGRRGIEDVRSWIEFQESTG